MGDLSRFLITAVVVIGFTTPASADHLPKAAHFTHWQRADRTFYELKPTTTPRALREAAPDRRPKELTDRAAEILEDGSKFALILLENDQVVFEGYANDATKDSKLTSMSAAKSLAALAVGEALCAGKIKSLDDPAQTYASQLSDTAFGRASVRNLLKMASGSEAMPDQRSGIDWDTYMQVATNKIPLIDYIRKYGAQETSLGSPINQGERFAYNGLNTDSLVFVVEGATGTSFTKWFEQTVWAKAQGGATSFWQVDKQGEALAESVFIASARDYARIALYTLDRLAGKASDECMTAFLREATQPLMSTDGFKAGPSYGFQIWVHPNGNRAFVGHGGQFVAFNDKSQRALVSLAWQYDWDGIFELLDGWVAKH